MPKVIGYDNSVAKKITCKHCSAINEYVQMEVKSYHGTDISGGPDGSEWINCGNCNARVIIRSW